ncbi:MAG: hypothetical protein K2M43_01750 [Mycoplasmoidaceae bacterium]|nr:hypothetical protein [Mycoplasmoidaceae bacterium]
MEVSIFTASTVISLVYGSIAILISLKFSKQIILVSTIAIAVFFQVVQTVIPLVAPTPRELGKSKYAINMCTGNFFDREVEDTKCFMYQENGITTGDYDFEYTTNELNHKLQSASGLGVINMFDVSGQFASLYNLGKLNPYRDADIAAYSLSPTVKYITTPEDAVFSNPLDPQIDPSTGKFLPKMAPEYDTENEPEH